MSLKNLIVSRYGAGGLNHEQNEYSKYIAVESGGQRQRRGASRRIQCRVEFVQRVLPLRLVLPHSFFAQPGWSRHYWNVLLGGGNGMWMRRNSLDPGAGVCVLPPYGRVLVLASRLSIESHSKGRHIPDSC